MPLYLTDEQLVLKDMIRNFIAKKAPVAHLRQLRDPGDEIGFSRALWRQFAEMGLASILLDEPSGGLGLGHVEAGIVLEEIGRNLTPSPFLTTAVTAVEALRGTGHAARWFAGIRAGLTIASIAIDEGPKHRDRIALVAERCGAGFRLSGTKHFVLHAHVADLLIVAARTGGSIEDADGITLFALERNAPGVAIHTERLADASLVSQVDFQGAVVDREAVIGEVDGGRDRLARILLAGRAGVAAELVGVGAAAMSMTLEYLKQRKQFGVAIGSFQALQHRSAHLYSEMELAAAAVLKAQQLLDTAAEPADAAVSVAKAQSALASALAVQEGVQMHGGIGMTDQYDIGLYMKRQRTLAELWGDANYHADRIARDAGF